MTAFDIVNQPERVHGVVVEAGSGYPAHDRHGGCRRVLPVKLAAGGHLEGNHLAYGYGFAAPRPGPFRARRSGGSGAEAPVRRWARRRSIMNERLQGTGTAVS